jgi:F0F1-type ATP synthase assembly protein I
MSDLPASSGDREPPFSEASVWVSRVTTMIAPGLVGIWADRRFGTTYLALVGFLVGLAAGITQIVLGPGSPLRKPRKPGRTSDPTK